MAAKAGTLFLSLAAFYLPVFANVAVAEKPHLGVPGFARASHRGLAAAKPLTAPGVAGCLCDFGGRSRSAGKERDAETGLDYFGARYFSGAQGRFTSPDKPFADQFVEDPQSWNLYSYARNNPLRNVDVDGNAAVAVELLRNGQQTFNIPNPGSKLLGAVMIGVGATAAYATDAGFRSDVNRSVSAGVNAFLQAAPNTAYGDPGGLGPIAYDSPFMSQDASASGNGSPAPSPNNAGPGNMAPDPGPERPYKRPSNATTPEQRASVQGQPCATCGATGQRNNADHKEALVKEYYRTGTIDRQRMRAPNSVQPQCANCSNQQGGWLSNFSKQMKRLIWGEGSANE